MCRRIAILALVVLLGTIVPVRADRLILKDSRIFRGKVTTEKNEDGRLYTIVTEDGQTLTFPKDEVKRYIHESSLNDWGLLQTFEEWRALVKPVLELEEPKQREFLFKWYDHVRDIRAHLWRTPPASDKFVDEWARYTANFTAVAESVKYKKLMDGHKGSNSLKEYVRFPPEGREETAGALKEAIESFEVCLNSATATNNLVRNLPREHVKQARLVRRRKADATKAHARSSSARDAARRHRENQEYARRAVRKDAEVYEQILRMASRIEEKTQNADARVNRFAQERVVTVGQVKTANAQIERIGTREGLAKSGAAPETAATLLPDTTITQHFRRIVEKHRANATDLTTVGLKALRDGTLSDIEALYVGKQFTLELEVKDIGEGGPDGYTLIADHSADWGDTVIQAVEFYFDAGVKYELIRCKKGAKVEVVARVKRVSLRPDLPVLETSDQTAGVHLIGDVVRVKRACKWD